MSLKPKSNTTWTPNTDSTLPLYYKDKLQKDSSVIDKINRNCLKTSSQKRKMLGKAFILSITMYGILWLYSLIPPSKNRAVSDVWSQRRDQVKDVFLQSWHDYSSHGWGKDIYGPVSQTGKNMASAPLGWIIVDSLDTLMLMDCEEELQEAKAWVEYELNYDIDADVNTFETTIRMLGGLLSAHYLSGDEVYLEKAVHLGNKLLGAFESESGIPFASVNLKTGKGKRSHGDRGASSTAEVSTLQLEFKYLAKLTGESLYWEKAEKVMEVLDSNHPTDGLVPIFVQPDSGKYQGNLIRLGSRGDSYYEYLLKQYIQTNEKIYLEMYLESFDGIKKHLYNKSQPNGLTFLGELEKGLGNEFSNKMDHLVCFIGGLFALGATDGKDLQTAMKQSSWSTHKQEQFKLGEEMAYTCYKMYHDVDATGLAPEIVVFNTDSRNTQDFTIKPADRHNLQRPETVETLYYLWKITGDIKYREWGYEIFENFVKGTLVTGGKDNKPRYTSLDDVTKNPPKKRDNMESFWLAETLKYLYLLFDDSNNSKWSLDNVVYNTEAHPFPKFDPAFKTGWVRESPEIIKARRQKEILEKETKEVEAAANKLGNTPQHGIQDNDDDTVTIDVDVKAPHHRVELAFDDDGKIITVTEGEPKKHHEKADKLVNDAINGILNDDIKATEKHFDTTSKNRKTNSPVSPSLEEQVNEVVLELANEKTEIEDLEAVQEAKIAASKDNEMIAEKIKQSGELPTAKQPVAKPLAEQVESVIDEAIIAEDAEAPKHEAT